MSGPGPVVAAPADDLEREATLIARHLLGETPPSALVARYVEACRELFAGPVDAVDAAMLAFVWRHPWSLGPLDAAAGIRRPAARLRGKVLVMAAILETSPEYAELFLPRDVGPFRLCAGLAIHGAAAVWRVLAGLVLWPGAVRAGREAEGARS